MPENISSNFFTYVGSLLGIVIGLIFYFLKILGDTVINFLVAQILAAFIFLLFQIILGVSLHKPRTSSNIFIGYMIIPVTYFLIDIIFAKMSQQIVNLQEIVNVYLGWMLVQVFMLYPFLLLSKSVQFFAGYDTEKLEEIERFGYVVSLPENTDSSKLKEIVEDRLSIESLKNKLKIIVRDQARNDSELCFFFYTIRNDTVTKFGDDEKLMDFKAQVEGLLTDWKKRDTINSYEETSELPETSELYSIFGRRKIKIFSIHEIKVGISRFPKEHPSLFALTIAIISAILGALFTKMLI